MNRAYKKDKYEWGCYLFIGVALFIFLLGFFAAILMFDYSVFFKIPIALLSCFILLFLYSKFLTLYTGNKIPHLITRQISKVSIGWLVIMLFDSITIGCLYLSNYYLPQKVEFSLHDQFYGLTLFAVVAVGEEIICRGIIYKLVCDRWNIYVALIISSLIFGIMHIFNDGATL